MDKLKFTNFNENTSLDSRLVSQMLDKNHADLIRDIKKYIDYLGESKIAFTDFFIESSYVTTQNKILPCYKITKKGCEFVAHKLTGQKGTVFTAKYINAFEALQANTKSISNNEDVIQMLVLSQKNIIEMIKALTTTVDSLTKSTINPKQDIDIKNLLKNQSPKQKSKVLHLPNNMIDIVNTLLSSRDRNFSYISRYLYEQGYEISNVAVSKYYYNILLGGK